jgi:hypothetical protein
LAPTIQQNTTNTNCPAMPLSHSSVSFAIFCEILAQLEKVFDPPKQIVLMNLDLLEGGSLEPVNKFLHPGDVMTKVFHQFRPAFDDWLQIFGLEL